MEARSKKIEELMNLTDTTFFIPVYQRDYNWEEKQCQILLNDIISVYENKNSTHFIGSIVYIKENIYATDEKKELEIIDGQQRLTTLTLLLMVIYHISKNRKMRKINSEQIYEQYLVNKYSTKSIKLKLLVPEENLKILDDLLNERFQNLKNYEETNIFKNYMYFKNKIEAENEEKIEKILIGFKKLIFIEISLEKGKDEPQKIFESLNSTGLALSQADLIRNYILMNQDKEKQNEIFKDIWVPIENNCKIKNIQNKKIENYTSDFIRDYLTLKTGEIPSKNKVFEIFKKYYEVKEDKKLQKIKNYSNIYSMILNPELEKNKKIREELKNFKLLGYSIINPFLMGIIKKFQEEIINEKEIIEILSLIQSYLWRRYITGEPTNALNKTFQNLYLRIFEKSEGDNYFEKIAKILIEKNFPTDEELKIELKIKNVYKEKERLKYVFKKLENYSHKELIDFENEDITIEHIFPQKPTKKWEEVLGSEINEMIIFKDTLPNLTLTGSNSNLGNKTFLEKRDLIRNGYKESKLYLNKYLAEINEWNIIEMNKRYEVLFQDILKIWKRPKFENSKIEEKIFYIKNSLVLAKGKLLKDGKSFELLKGSELLLEEKTKENILKTNLKILKELKENNLLEKLEGKYILKENYILSTPSGASCLVLGKSSNGWINWKTRDGEILDKFRKK